jgi:hypothetical protein
MVPVNPFKLRPPLFFPVQTVSFPKTTPPIVGGATKTTEVVE